VAYEVAAVAVAAAEELVVVGGAGMAEMTLTERAAEGVVVAVAVTVAAARELAVVGCAGMAEMTMTMAAGEKIFVVLENFPPMS
jgi:hypothetical protein